MPINKEREYRSMPILARQEENEECRVKGYATTFNQPYTLFEFDGVEYKEEIDRNAFDECDMTDVVFQYNHSGMVYARSRAKKGLPTLRLTTDEHGLDVDADLSSTKASRELFEAIDKGLIDQMSFGFSVAEDTYDEKTHTRRITKIKKLYDVSAVDFPANPNTQIDVATRSAFDGFIESEKKEILRRAKDKLLLLLELEK